MMALSTVAAEHPRGMCGIPLFPPVAEHLRLRLGARARFEEVKGLISLEPGIAAQLLTAANSKVYGYASSVYTVEESMMALGWDEMKRLVLAVIAAEQPVPDRIQPLVRACWSHTVASAFAAVELAGAFGVSGDRAYTLALMHNIGRFGLLAVSPDAYHQVFSLHCGSPLECLGAEEIALGMDHAKAGSWLVRSWGLPAEFSEAAATHHELVFDPERPTAILVALACAMAHTAGFAFGSRRPIGVRTASSRAPAHLQKRLQSEWNEMKGRSRAKLLEALLCCLEPGTPESVEEFDHAC